MSTKTLQEQRDELQEKVDALQIEAAERRFEIQFNDRKMVKTVMDHLNKGYTWKTANAAVIVTLYDQLKQQNKELTNSDSEDTVISLRGHELNALYQALLNVEGTGIENARRFIKMLTNVGSAVTDAMKELSDMNQEIGQLHQQLSEIDQEIDELENANTVEQVEPELEVVSDETEK